MINALKAGAADRNPPFHSFATPSCRVGGIEARRGTSFLGYWKKMMIIAEFSTIIAIFAL
ncbi:MAG: hypothetical protein HDS73_04050 [Bacteroidales bacterium]|nr:hypothetical protein [Bacteroidales bacterium]